LNKNSSFGGQLRESVVGENWFVADVNGLMRATSTTFNVLEVDVFPTLQELKWE